MKHYEELSPKEMFLEKMKKPFVNHFLEIQKKPLRMEDEEWVEESYHLLKQLRDGAALFKIDTLVEVSYFLLKKIQIQDMRYFMEQKDQAIWLEGIKLLIQYLFEGEKNAKSSSQEDVENKKLLYIVDEDHLFVEWVQDGFQNSSFHIVPMYFDNLIENMNQQLPSLLLINVSNQQAISILTQPENQHLFQQIPVLGMTQHFGEESIVKILEYGVDDLLQKPFALSIVHHKMDKLVQEYEAKNHRILHQKVLMLENLAKEWDRFRRFQSYFSLLLLKIDKLQDNKSLMNTIYEYAVSSIRTYDEVCIWSDDTLMFLLPATKQEEAEFVGNRINKVLESNGLQQLKAVMVVAESDPRDQNVHEMIEHVEKKAQFSVPSDGIVMVRSKQVDSSSVQEGRIKVLVVDHDPVTGSILHNSLNSNQWDIELCLDGREAMTKVLQFQPHIIISETTVHHLDAFMFCSQVRNLPSLSQTVFIFLSSQYLPHHIARGFKAGADDFLAKPFSMKELETRLDKFGRQAKARQLEA
ncbi:response regulator [Bacillus kexueae]|uniref:response regulator n=1 Tax=Aeribacillus kexueae TaxID=2078952 RepID=UPI001FB04722|nr:response regulator [Bacillus kexueae]